MKRAITFSLTLCTAALLFTAGLQTSVHASEQGKKEIQQLPSVAVQTAKVQQKMNSMQVQVVGTLQAVHRATIAAKLTGTIEKMPVVLGSTVKKGDLLVQISAGEIEARLAQAKAQLAQTQRNLDREKKLLAKRATTAETVKNLEDGKRIAEAAVREAQTMQDYVTVRAPFEGVITEKQAHVGDLATPGAPLIKVENIGALQVVTAVPEAQLLQIKAGDKLHVHIPAAELTTEGIVAEIAPAADPLSRTAPVKLNLPPSENLRPGQFARVSLPGKSRPSLYVPDLAVQRFGQMEIVFVVENGHAQLRLVKSGSRVDGMLEILSGLEEGETVVISSASPLVSHQPVNVQQ